MGNKLGKEEAPPSLPGLNGSKQRLKSNKKAKQTQMSESESKIGIFM